MNFILVVFIIYVFFSLWSLQCSFDVLSHHLFGIKYYMLYRILKSKLFSKISWNKQRKSFWLLCAKCYLFISGWNQDWMWIFFYYEAYFQSALFQACAVCKNALYVLFFFNLLVICSSMLSTQTCVKAQSDRDSM